MYQLSKLTDKLHAGNTAIGSHVAFDSPFVTEMIAGAGFDYIWIDAEHGAYSRSDIQLHLLACRAAGAVSFVRVPNKDPDFIKSVLDMGADGIIVPMVNTAEDARKAAASTHYPPAGIRGMGLRRACNYGIWDKDEYIGNTNKFVWTVVQIEHIDAMRELEEMVRVPGIDAFIVGPNDFSMSMWTGEWRYTPQDEEVQARFDEIAATVCRSGKYLGVSGFCTEPFISQWVKRGASLISLNFDFQYVVSGAKNALDTAKKTLEECCHAGSSNSTRLL